jgi:signal transduction histidine kinase
MPAGVIEQPRFLSEIAHELRAPLSALATGSELLTTDYEELDAGQVRELVSVIHRGTIWLQGLVENILCASTVQAGHFQIHTQPVDLLDVIDEVRSVLAPVLSKKGQALRVASRCAAPEVSGDRRRLVQVLVNLISNASKFSPAGTSIDITVRRQKSHLRITVADRGPGLPPGRAARLFEPYYRATPVAHGGKEGVGLGLAIVQWIVTQHNGRVAAGNRRGGGARFSFDLPSVNSSNIHPLPRRRPARVPRQQSRRRSQS